MQPTGLCVLHWRPSQGSEGDPPSSDIRLGGGEHSADPALEVARPVASAFPWTTSASGVEIGLLDGSRNSWRSVRPCDGGAASSGSGMKVADRSILHRICGVQHTDPVT
jgi:hypothetical protein